MHSFRKVLAQSQSLILATAAIATTIALAGSIDRVSANPGIEPHLSSQSSPVVTRQDTPVISKVVLGDLSGLIILLVIGWTIVAIPLFFGGLVIIGEREVGVVVKKFTMSGKGLSPDRLIALNGEAGLQADTLAPGPRCDLHADR